MKNLMLAMLLVFALSIPAIAIEKKTDSPSQDVIIMVQTPIGPMYIRIQKGMLNEENHYTNWVTPEEHEAFSSGSGTKK